MQGQRCHEIASILRAECARSLVCLLPKIQLITSTRIAQLLLRGISVDIRMSFFILIKLTYLLLIMLLETYLLRKHLPWLATIRHIFVAHRRLLANSHLHLLVTALTTHLSKALLLHYLNGLIQLIGRHLLPLVIVDLLRIFLLQIYYLILPDVILLLLVCQHLVKQLLDLLTILALSSVILIRSHLKPASSAPICSLEPLVSVGVIATRMHTAAAHSVLKVVGAACRVRHQYVVTALVALVRLAQLVDLFQGLGLLVFLGVQARVHVQVRNLLLGVDCHVLILLYLDLLINIEHLHVAEGKIDILEREHCFHRHEKRDACLYRKALMLLGQRILYQELVELPYLLAAKGQHVKERHELFNIEWIALR